MSLGPGRSASLCLFSTLCLCPVTVCVCVCARARARVYLRARSLEGTSRSDGHGTGKAMFPFLVKDTNCMPREFSRLTTERWPSSSLPSSALRASRLQKPELLRQGLPAGLGRLCGRPRVMLMSEQEPDTGIAATCPNAAVEFCRGAVSPCDDSCAYCYAALDGSAGVTCGQCSKRRLCSDKCRDRDWEVLCSIALAFPRPPSPSLALPSL